MTDQAELRNEVFRRRRPIGLVLIVERVAERLRGIVEDDGEMGRRDADRGVTRIGEQLPQHVAETRYRIDREAIGFAVERRDGMERPEDESGAVDEEEMITVFHGQMDSAG
ncbi:hypothetical protein D9M72_471560 [compost metagenome]